MSRKEEIVFNAFEGKGYSLQSEEKTIYNSFSDEGTSGWNENSSNSFNGEGYSLRSEKTSKPVKEETIYIGW